MGKVAMSPLPSRGFPSLKSGEVNQKWPTSGQSGYVTPAFSGIPTASERGAKSEVAPLWAKWLRHPRRLGDPHRFRAEGENRKWPTSGQSGYITPPVSGISIAAGRGRKSEVAHKWAKWLRHPCRLGDLHRFRAGGKMRSGPQVAKWLRHPCRLGDPHRFRAGGKIRSGPQVGKVATSPLPSRGSPPLKSGGQNHKWPTSGKVATSPLPSRGSPPLQSGGPNQKWPTSGKVATSPLPSRGSPPLRSGGQSKKWPTSGQSGYITPAVSGIPTASERGAK